MSASMARIPHHQTKMQFSTTGNHPSTRSKIEWTYNKIIPGRKGVAFLRVAGRHFDRALAHSARQPWPSVPAPAIPRAFINTKHFLKLQFYTWFLSYKKPYRVRCPSCCNMCYKCGGEQLTQVYSELIFTRFKICSTWCFVLHSGFHCKRGSWNILCVVLYCYA